MAANLSRAFWFGSISARHTATNSPPRAGFFVPAVCVSFCFLARLPFRQRMRPGAYIGNQCLCGVPSDSRESAEKRPRESTLSRTRNMWRGGRAPCALPNVPRPVGTGPSPVSGYRPAACPVWASNFLKLPFKPVRAGTRGTQSRTASLLAFSAARGARIARRRRGSASGIKVHVFHKQY